LETDDVLFGKVPFDDTHMLGEDDLEVLWLNEEPDAVLMTLRCLECGEVYKRPCDRPGEVETDAGARVASRCPKCLNVGPAALLGVERGPAFVEEKEE